MTSSASTSTELPDFNSPKDIEDYYQAHIDKYVEPEKLKLRTIMVRKTDSEDGEDVAWQNIENIHQQLKNGADFASLAKERSEGSRASEGGLMGFIARGDLISGFESIVFDLSVGELSPILESTVGYHIFFVEGQQEQKVKDINEVRDDIRDLVYREKAKERYNKWMEELKSNAYISIK